MLERIYDLFLAFPFLALFYFVLYRETFFNRCKEQGYFLATHKWARDVADKAVEFVAAHDINVPENYLRTRIGDYLSWRAYGYCGNSLESLRQAKLYLSTPTEIDQMLMKISYDGMLLSCLGDATDVSCIYHYRSWHKIFNAASEDLKIIQPHLAAWVENAQENAKHNVPALDNAIIEKFGFSSTALSMTEESVKNNRLN